MNKLLKLSAIAAAIAASGAAYADPAETKGGIKVKTEDGRFEANLGGRIHFDANLIKEDKQPFNGITPKGTANSGFFFRRIYLTVTGKAYGWKYKIEPDFAPGNANGATSIAFQDVFLATDLGPGEIQLGQRKPFRAMEDLTSSNDLLMIERPFASSSGGMFKGGTGASSSATTSVTNAGGSCVTATPCTGSVTTTTVTAANDREFQQGVFYHGNGDNYTWGLSVHSLRRDNTAGSEGIGESARVTFAPILSEGSVIHLGLSYSGENPANNQGASSSTSTVALGAGGFAYGGRRGPTFNLGSTTGKVDTIGLEYANVFGPFFAQAEYMTQKEKVGTTAPINAKSQTVNAFYVQGSFFLTGETKPYKNKDGVFGSAKPINDFGAVELTARYDMAKNKDFPGASGTSCSAAGADKCQVSAITVGTNYYFNPNVRFMVNYIMGTADQGAGGKDKPKTLAARFQMNW